MEFILSFLLLVFNLINYEIDINRIVFLAISAVLVSGLFYTVYKKNRDFLCTCLILMCHTWQISWMNIFGDASESLQLPWFYLFGALIVLYAIANLKTLKEKPVNSLMLGLFVVLVIISVYPLLISRSKSQGLKEFLMIAFFIVLTFIAFISGSRLDKKKREAVVNAYIYAVALSSLFIILQSALYMAFGRTLFKFSVGNYFGKTMISAKLLMEDTSCSTIMLGSAVFYMIEKINEKKHRALNVLLLVATIVALALTTRRTSIVSLVVVLGFYVFIRYKGVLKKMSMAFILVAITAVMAFLLLVVRPVDDYSQLLNPNGRFENYISAITVFFENPFGVGYDNVHLESLMDDGIIPHNTLLRWLDMAGIMFTLLMLVVLLYVLSTSYRKKLTGDFWVLAYCLFAMNFIPDLLNARFFVIPCMLVLLSSASEEEPLEKRNSLLSRKV